MPVIDVVFGSRTRAGVLRALLLDEPCNYRLLELARAVGTSVSSVQAELVRLEGIGLVRSRRVGDARVITANQAHPLAGPLRGLLLADVGSSLAATPADTLKRLNPAIRSHADEVAAAAARHGVLKLALVGSATQTDGSVVPSDLDVLVRLDPSPEGYAERYFGLLAELERIVGMPVDIIEEDAVRNPYLAREFEATQVVLYEAA